MIHMSKSATVLVTLALVLAGAYVYWFTDFFHSPTIQILKQNRPARPSRIPRGEAPAVYPVSFAFDGKYALTEVKVVSVEEAKTNKYPHPLWHLISDSNSIPTKAVVYGMPVKGMKPSVPKARPEPLMPDTTYRLLVTAGSIKGQTDFKASEVPQQ